MVITDEIVDIYPNTQMQYEGNQRDSVIKECTLVLVLAVAWGGDAYPKVEMNQRLLVIDPRQQRLGWIWNTCVGEP